jgi:hypothetical protein
MITQSEIEQAQIDNNLLKIEMEKHAEFMRAHFLRQGKLMRQLKATLKEINGILVEPQYEDDIEEARRK